MPRPTNAYLHMVASHLTSSTQKLFDRAVQRALAGKKGSAVPLRRAIGVATRELTAMSMDATTALAHLSAIVENAGIGSVGDRMSLITGKSRWMTVRDQVLVDARAALEAA